MKTTEAFKVNATQAAAIKAYAESYQLDISSVISLLGFIVNKFESKPELWQVFINLTPDVQQEVIFGAVIAWSRASQEFYSSVLESEAKMNELIESVYDQLKVN